MKDVTLMRLELQAQHLASSAAAGNYVQHHGGNGEDRHDNGDDCDRRGGDDHLPFMSLSFWS